jgi:Rhs element Vgr protein
MPVIPTDLLQNGAQSRGVVTLTVLVNGEAIPGTVQIYSVDVWQELNRIPRAQIAVLDGSVADETFQVSDEDWFIPGNEIEVQIGYQSEEEMVFKGIVTGQSIKVRPNGNSILMVDCADPSVKMTTTPRSRYFYEVKESDVFETIIGNYSGLSPDVEVTAYTHKELLQFQSTDWDFILSRADVNGQFVVVDGGTVAIKSPDFGQEPVAAVKYGNNLLEIDAEIDGTNQFAGVKGFSWDYSQSETSEVDGSSLSPVTPGNLTSGDLSGALENSEWALRAGAKLSSEVLQKWADSKLMKHELAKVRGRAKIRGLHGVKPASVLTLDGVGGRFNGNAFVSGVKHQFYKGEWLMDIQFGLSPKWFSEEYKISELPAGGMLPSVSGLQIGLVTQIEGDPDGDERILVRLPMIDTEEQGVWARLATFGAGENRGFLFRPELDDEVVVGFIHGDPNQPIILGSLHSSAKPAPIEASDDNHEKGLVSRGDVKMILNDDDPSVLLEMPSGKKVSVNDADGEILVTDENGNQILIDSDGITLESPSDITLKATGDLNLEGTNINLKANAGFKAEGSASAEISSTGSTAVKGSIVQIN